MPTLDNFSLLSGEVVKTDRTLWCQSN